MAFSSTRWGSNAFFPAIERRVFLLVQEYSTCWNEKSSMTFRLRRAQHSAINMRCIATRFHDVIVLAGAETAIRRCMTQQRGSRQQRPQVDPDSRLSRVLEITAFQNPI